MLKWTQPKGSLWKSKAGSKNSPTNPQLNSSQTTRHPGTRALLSTSSFNPARGLDGNYFAFNRLRMLQRCNPEKIHQLDQDMSKLEAEMAQHQQDASRLSDSISAASKQASEMQLIERMVLDNIEDS